LLQVQLYCLAIKPLVQLDGTQVVRIHHTFQDLLGLCGLSVI
jgi:hypothetical protein